MAYLEAVTLRQAVQARCVAALTGYTRSAYPFEMLPASSRDLQHKTFAVGLGRTVNYVPRQRQKVSKGVSVLTRVMVSYTYRLRADGMVSDLNAAMGGEIEVAEAVKALTLSGLSGLTVEDASRNVDGVLFKSTITFRAVHKIRNKALPTYTATKRVFVERTLDHTLFPNAKTSGGGASGDSYTWTMSVPPRGIVRRAAMVLTTTTNHADFKNGEDGGGVFVMPDGPADQTVGLAPLTAAQSQGIVARSAMNGQRFPAYGGGNLKIASDGATSLYVTMMTLDWAHSMFTTQNANKDPAGQSHPVGFYYDFSADPSSEENVNMFFTWVASARDWTNEVYSGRFILEIEPTVTG